MTFTKNPLSAMNHYWHRIDPPTEKRRSGTHDVD